MMALAIRKHPRRRDERDPGPGELKLAPLLRAQAQAFDGVFSGFLEDLHLSDFIQVLQLGQRSAEITIWAEADPGIILMDRGRPIHAETGLLRGKEAFLEICSWQSGEIHVRALTESPESSIDSALSHLLLELADRVDNDAKNHLEEGASHDLAGSEPEVEVKSPSERDPSLVVHLQGEIGRLCADLIAKGSEVVAAGVVSSGLPTLLGGAYTPAFPSERLAAFGRSIVGLYHMADRRPLKERHSHQASAPGADDPFDELELSSADFHHFVRLLEPRPILACLITRRAASLGMGRALLGTALPRLGSLIAELRGLR